MTEAMRRFVEEVRAIVRAGGIHVYGAAERRAYDAATGEVKTFVSGWG